MTPESPIPASRSEEPRSQTGRWTQKAGFSVLFDVIGEPEGTWRTRIYHDESGEETTLTGEGVAPWPSWILARLGVHQRQDGRERSANPADRPSGIGHEITVTVLDVRLVNRLVENDDEQRACIEADLRITGLAALQRELGAAILEAGINGRTG